MSRPRSFSTLLWLVLGSLAVPLANDGDDDDDDPDDGGGCWSDEPVVSTRVQVPDSVSPAVLAPYERPPTPRPSPSQHPHATLPTSDRSQTPAVLGGMLGLLAALAAFVLAARYVTRRRAVNPRFRSKKRLSDESWVSPMLPALASPGSPLSQDLELSRYASSRRKLVPVTTPDAEFGSRIWYPRVPSPVYIPPFSPSPSLSSSSSSLSTESPSPDPARLSRLLSSTFGDPSVPETPARPSTAHLIHTARSYAHAYRPTSATTSLYTPPTPSPRLSGARSRASFYPAPTVRDTLSSVTTADTDLGAPTGAPVGTLLGLKLRLSDASEHERYRLRERERERERRATAVEREFKLRDSESVLREIGW